MPSISPKYLIGRYAICILVAPIVDADVTYTWTLNDEKGAKNR